MGTAGTLVLALLLIASVSAGLASSDSSSENSLPPLAKITCPECENFQQVGGTFRFWVDQGKEITLSGGQSVGSGKISSYLWTRNGAPYNNGQSIAVVADKNEAYALTVADSNGKTDTKEAQINVIGKKYCLPSWGDAKVYVDSGYGNLNRHEFSAGDVVPVKIDKPEYDSSCDVDFFWAASDPEAVIFADEKKFQTTVTINQPRRTDVLIQPAFSSGDRISVPKEETWLRIVLNAPPTIRISYEQDYGGYGNSRLIFSCEDSTTGAGVNENNDFISYFSANLTDEYGNKVSNGHASAAYGEQIGDISLATKGAGIYTLSAEIRDSHGASASATAPIVVDPAPGEMPKLIVPGDVYCRVGEECVVEVSLTNAGQDASIEFWDTTYPGDEYMVCECAALRQTYDSSGERSYEVRLKKFGGDQSYEAKKVTIHVKSG